ASLTVPTATSVRAIPAKLMIDNRTVINNHLKRARGGKVSFTHLIGYAMIKALRQSPEMNTFFTELDGKPAIGYPDHINLGIAIDLAKEDGSRQLLVPSIKGCEELDFGNFWSSYEALVKKARAGALSVEDFSGTTVSLTNPGTLGTVHSVPRLVTGQGLILGVGAMDYPAEFQGASQETIADLAISKVITLTSTYDHRIIQGAQSGDFLKKIHEILLGADSFYEEIFAALRIPYVPITWHNDIPEGKEQLNKAARLQQLIQAYRTSGHLMADTDPLEYKQRSHPDLDVITHGLTLWDLDREIATGGFGGRPFAKMRNVLGILRDSYCRSIGIEYMYIDSPEERKWIQSQVEVGSPFFPREEQLRILRKLNSAEAFETFLHTKFVGQKRFSLEGGESVIPILDAIARYAAKAKQAPVFHVNGDDPEACVRVARVAFEYRQSFNKDVIIDMVCYRRRGHNEGDEPSFTQPRMYKLIDAKRSTRVLYAEALVGRGDITQDESNEIAKEFQGQLEAIFNMVHDKLPEQPEFNKLEELDPLTANTAISEEIARKIAATQIAIPDGFKVHPKLAPQLQRRISMLDDGTIDWSGGEMLALGSLLLEGHSVRLAGQDVGRGTFSNRHAVIRDYENGSEWIPLRELISGSTHLFVIDSLLSEYAALGFEYGYSLEREDALVLWEAQFGDFANGAQTIIDEFISSSLQKWGERSSLVMLLPHGYEGQGPDHSSGRIERFLSLAAENNMTIAQPSSASSYFHLLRWHVKNPARRPLIVFEPKSMLRLKAAAAQLSDFTSGTFTPVLSDPAINGASKVVLCSGKIYWELVSERAKRSDNTTAIIRLEQLYPLAINQILAELSKSPNAKLIWVQDEPANQGPWPFISSNLQEALGARTLTKISRKSAASPATGSIYIHEQEQKTLIAEVFAS
ncbi:MAG: multifunctional oxoglutarate decarboxylase/oxoglutarate dehydrogenase thiamine pyrophosphate-binding subunit/dihydrolipoyllysine-residue succinyltransferase subunit, partial [Actinobacteria bacterium]|nr:multifunctional oxoglutarate decarboxylase/oxoglutarate dehydrogenase thiamine pyrophosphate-binding subunit/dihydrolipoyllysine-residue succinyltransferase subunit [Actinomycetota bacterium]